MTKYFLSLFREEKLISRRARFSSARLSKCRQVFLLFCLFVFFFVCPSQKGSHSPRQAFPQVASQLFSNFWYLAYLFSFPATFCSLSNFSRFLVILRYRNSIQCLNWPSLKRSQILLPGADHGRKMYAAGLLGQRFLKENLKWRRKPVSGEEGHSTSLLAHTRIFTRLILTLTGAHD